MKFLSDRIEKFLASHAIPFTYFPAEQSGELLGMLAARRDFDLRNRWLWAGKKEAIRIPYENDKQWEFGMEQWLPRFDERIFLAVTGDEFAPWPVFEIPKDSLEELVGEVSFFEYLIFDLSFENVLFDTHDNVIVVVGESTGRVALERLIPVIKEVVAALVAKDYEGLAGRDVLKLLPAEAIREIVEEYPGTMTMPPDAAFEKMSVFGVTDQWRAVDMYLWFDGAKAKLAIVCKIMVRNGQLVYGIEGILVP